MNDLVLHFVVEWIRHPRANTNTLDEFMQTRGVPEVDRRYYAQQQKDFRPERRSTLLEYYTVQQYRNDLCVRSSST